MNLQEQFKQKTLECIATAEKQYRVAFGEVAIYFDITGNRIAGQACYDDTKFWLRFHPDAVENHFEKMVAETIPHEVAHLVCFANPKLGKSHDAGWASVYHTLSGGQEASRTHDLEFGKARRKLKTFDYMASCGTIVTLTSIRHNKLQRGTVEYYSLAGGGKITKDDLI